jgi:hypothetical protein
MMAHNIEERSNDDGDVFRWLVLDGGARYSNLDCIGKAEQASRAFSRWFHRSMLTATMWSDPTLSESDTERLTWLLDDMEAAIGSARQGLAERQGARRREAKVKALRRIAGRTPEEAEAYLAKAAELEREGDTP